jgi:hypothetical protein
MVDLRADGVHRLHRASAPKEQDSMTPEDNLNMEFEARLRFETLIADLSSKFVRAPASVVDREIMDAERLICEFLGLDISALWQWSDEPPGFFTLTHYYSAREGPKPEVRLNHEDFPLVPAADAGGPHRGHFLSGGYARGGSP